MSIIIKKVEMPEHCGECLSSLTAGAMRWQSKAQTKRRDLTAALTSAPLVELPPHGRLIDADALWEKVKSERALKEHCPKSRSIIYDTGFLAGYRAACQIASKMPVIIPAEPGEEADHD